IGQDQGDGGREQSGTGREHPGKHENSRRGILCPHAKTGGEILVNRENFIVVIGFDENKADQNAGEDRSKSELDIGEIAQGVAFPRSAEEGAGAGFSGDNGSEYRPPWNTPPAKGEILEVTLTAAHAQADKNDNGEIGEEDE